MAGKIVANEMQLGDSATASQNFVLQTNADGTCKLARGNVGATTQDILTVDAAGIVTATNGLVSNRMVMSAVNTTTGGTSIDFTSIPTWVKRITISLSGVSLSATAVLRIRLGVSGTPETSGYMGATGLGVAAGYGVANIASGFDIGYSSTAAELKSGVVVITNISGNLWAAHGTVAAHASVTSLYAVAGSKSLSGVLDMVRITSSSGTDTFDLNGGISTLYEG